MITRRPKILFLSSCWPFGQTFGGQLRALHTARALRQIGDVTLIVVGSEADNRPAALLSAAEFSIAPGATAMITPNQSAWQRIRWAADVRYLNIHGYVVSAADQARIRSSLTNYDLVWVLNSRTPNLLQLWHWPRAHLDIDDVPSSYLRRAAQTEPTRVGRWKAKTQSVLLYRRERCLDQRFTTLSVCSEADRVYLRSERIHVIPNGFARPDSPPVRNVSDNTPRIGFIGLYSYPPNLDGMRWFLREVWPALRCAVPGIRMRLIGKDSDGPLKPDESDVDALGWLEDPSAEIATWSMMIVPIRTGGGTRIKIADAFSRKCPVVSTRFGAYGYEVDDRCHLRLADTPEAFAQACVDIFRNQEIAESMAERAWKAFLEKWTWDAIEQKVCAAAEDCMRRSFAPASDAPVGASLSLLTRR